MEIIDSELVLKIDLASSVIVSKGMIIRGSRQLSIHIQ